MTAFVDRPLVYVAGPYTKPDPVENTHKILVAAGYMNRSGLVTCYVPHLSLFWHFVMPEPYQHWLDYDLAILARSDALLRVAGESSGADAEVKFAVDHGIPVFYTNEALMEWARARQ